MNTRGTHLFARLLPRLGLLLVAPLCTAWVGSGAGTGDWVEGEEKEILLERRLRGDAVVRFEPYAEAQIIVTLPLPGVEGDAVWRLVINDRGRGVGPVQLPDRGVEVTYTEYGADGERLFSADARARGVVELSGPAAGPLTVSVALTLTDAAAPGSWRRLKGLHLSLSPAADDGPDAHPHDSGGDHYYAASAGGGGCDSGYDDEGYDDSDEDWGGDSGGGCDGDDLDSGGSSSGGGCEGDSAGGGGCEGDAIASDGGRRRRSPWILRLINWTPWMLCFAAIRLMRRRRRW